MPSQKIACSTCDLLIDLPHLLAGEEAHCPQCDHIVAWQVRGSLHTSLAFLIAAAMMFILAVNFPFLSFESRGLSREITLWQVAAEFFGEGMPAVGIGVGALVIAIPGFLLLSHIYILVTVLFSRTLLPSSVFLLRMSSHLSPWNMVEIFTVGTLASLTKIASLATVYFGISFWAYLAFSIALTVSLLHFDRRHLWSLVDVPAQKKNDVKHVEILL